MRRFILLLVLSFAITFLFVGCSTTTNSKPDNIRQDIWDTGYELMNIIDKKMQNGERLTDKDEQMVAMFYAKYENDDATTISEMRIVEHILTMTKNLMLFKYNKDKGGYSNGDVLEEYNKSLEYLNKVYNK